MDCLFCKIAAGKIPSDKVYEDDELLAFRDIDPKAPTHILVIPKTHITSINQLDVESSLIVSKAFLLLKKIAKDEGISESGYRIVTNVLKDGGQTVDHLHFHLLGGRSLSWPPG
ncbi:MAG: histidine triad nucleotide-binding protein [Clostridium sp.]|jgi:histidine triad (HIT) family protein|nr:histidine triad nucleotide-binding protein [Clostridium sp.]